MNETPTIVASGGAWLAMLRSSPSGTAAPPMARRTADPRVGHLRQCGVGTRWPEPRTKGSAGPGRRLFVPVLLFVGKVGVLSARSCVGVLLGLSEFVGRARRVRAPLRLPNHAALRCRALVFDRPRVVAHDTPFQRSFDTFGRPASTPPRPLRPEKRPPHRVATIGLCLLDGRRLM